jgi:dipeptidyl aminopeptidase/acylaminoacyl peptidase
MKNTILVLSLLIGFQFHLSAQIEAGIELKEIMSGNSFIGHQPFDIKWSFYGNSIFYSKDTDSTDYAQIYEYSLKSKETTLIGLDQRNELNYYANSSFLLNDNELYYFDSKSKQRISVIDSRDQKSELQHVNNNQKVYFRQNNNLFSYAYSTGKLKQVTNFEMKSKNNEEKNDYYSKEESVLFDYYKDQQKLKKLPKKEDFVIPLNDKNLNSIQISPNEEFIIYRSSDKSKDKFTKVPHYIAKDGYTQIENARAKVGTKTLTDIELNIYNISKDSIYRLDFSFLNGIRKRPAYQKEYGFTGELENDKILVIHEVDFSKSGNFALISIKSQDNKDRWLAIYDFKANKVKEIEHQHNEAWIGGPGISGWNFIKGNMGWINEYQIYFQSEESGYSHLYLYDMKSNSTKALSSGDFEIHKVELSKSRKHLFITANKTHPGNRDFYKLDIETQEWTSLLTKGGNHEVTLSPDEKWMAVRYSYKNKPWEVYIAPLKENAVLTQITTSTKDSFKNIKWIEPELITFKSKDGKNINARVYKPAESNGNKAAVIFVHGAGYLQNAHNWWSSYYREYMFHNLLVEKGYTVLDIDYRASEGYGRAHRTDIYREMGGLDLSDNIDGRSYLIKEHGIDPEKVGIYGGSYGGFITLMALLKHPGVFACGGALRSVTDWAHYNHEYTSNILNTPELDSMAYRKSSPIYYADGLQDRLILFHGMIDDNVQYQDVIRLNQRFIELGKTNWNLVSYPFERHSFKSTSSWTDEYSRLLKMFDEELLGK